MQKINVLILAAALFLVSITPATASVRGGDRNFERAWRVFTYSQIDKAVEYFKVSAREYTEALQEDPRSRTMRFQSSMIKAGMSLYYAADFDLSITTMQQAVRKNERVWEVDLYTGLAYGRKGDQDNALKFLDLFLDSMSSQRFITDAVLKQVAAIKAGSVSLAQGIDAIEQATQRQFSDNVLRNSNQRGIPLAREQCGGAFWWRMNAAPCSRGSFRYY